jgi:hypothetical protein
MLFNWDRQGRLQDWYADASFGMELTRQTSVTLDRAESYELFDGHGFRVHNTNVSFSSDPTDWLGTYASYGVGTTINYFPGPGLNPFEADSTSASLGVTLRPTTQASIAQSYLYNGLRTRTHQVFTGTEARAMTVFNNHILRSKLNYQFTRELSLRLILDYNAVLPMVSLVALEKEKRFTSDVLLTYLVNPGTALYVGYADRYQNVLANDSQNPLAPSRQFMRGNSPLRLTDRQLFIKMSYLFRY